MQDEDIVDLLDDEIFKQTDTSNHIKLSEWRDKSIEDLDQFVISNSIYQAPKADNQHETQDRYNFN